jgi:hypothetical protein
MYIRIAAACFYAMVSAVGCRADQVSTLRPKPERHFLPTHSAAILSTQPRLVAALNRLLSRSRAFAREAAWLAARGKHVTVVARREVPWAALARSAGARFNRESAAAAMPLSDADGKVRNFLVVVDLAMLGRLEREKHFVRSDIEKDITRLLIHEIYGHAMPWLLNGERGGCFDPGPGQLPVNACSIRRENRIRGELGLGRRIDFGLDSFAVGRVAGSRL